MAEALSSLCYLSPEQLNSPPDLVQLNPLASAGAVHVTANAYLPASDKEKALGEAEQSVGTLLEKLGQGWEAETISEPSGKDWINKAQANYDLIVLFAVRNKAKYSLPVDWSMLRALEKPFLVINPGQKRRKRNKVLAAIDVANAKQEALNNHILATAAKMARIHEAELHILTAVQISQVAADLDLVDPIKQEAVFREKHMTELEQLATKYGAQPEYVHVKTGVPSQVIRKEAKKLDVLMSVVGTERRSGLSAMLFGNTAEKLLGQSPNNVLIVPPLG